MAEATTVLGKRGGAEVLGGAEKKRSATLNAIIELIRAEKKPQGTSLVRIVAGLKDTVPEKGTKKTLSSAVESGDLIKNRQSYLVSGDPQYEDQGERVTIEDKIEGTGKAVAVGDTVVISYRGTLAETGALFDQGSSFTFQVGAGDVVKGMDAGVQGLKVGGSRSVLIPSSLGYGKRGSGPEIPPNSALRFDITLKAIKK